MKKRIFSLVTAVLMLFSFAACAKQGADETAAKDTGKQMSKEVVIYSPNSDSDIAAVVPAFEKATGIKVILQSMGTGDVLARLEAEKQIRKPTSTGER